MDIQKKTYISKILFYTDPFAVDVYELTEFFEVEENGENKILSSNTVIKSYYRDDEVNEDDKVKQLIEKYKEVFFS